MGQTKRENERRRQRLVDEIMSRLDGTYSRHSGIYATVRHGLERKLSLTELDALACMLAAR